MMFRLAINKVRTRMGRWHICGGACNFTQNTICLFARFRIHFFKWNIFRAETCRTWFVIHLVEFISCDTDRHKSFQLTVQAVLLHSTACIINDFRIVITLKPCHYYIKKISRTFPCEHHWKSVDYFILAAAGHQIQAWRKLCMWWKVLFTRVFFIFCILCETKI